MTDSANKPAAIELDREKLLGFLAVTEADGSKVIANMGAKIGSKGCVAPRAAKPAR